MYSLGYNSFWSFGSAAVQELLTKSDLQLDELLDEDGLILEVKNHNQNLYDFLLKEDSFKQLIHSAISEPDVEKLEHNQKKCYKYPFTCADILSSDSQPIVSEFFKSDKDLREDEQKTKIVSDEDDEVNIEGDSLDNKDTPTTTDQTQDEEKPAESTEPTSFPYLDYLFSFLDSETLNLTSAGYFAKIVNNLLNKRPSELIAYIYEKKPELLQKMIKHIYSKSIAEFLAKVLTFESSVLANVNNDVYNDIRSQVLKEIIKKLQSGSDLEEINNTAYLICEVFGKYNSMHCSHDILHNLLENSAIDYFFDILKSGNSASACAVALILGNIFAYYILINTPKPQDSDDMEEGGFNAIPHQPLELSDGIPLLTAFIQNLGPIVKFIGESTGDGIPGQYGFNAVPFGSARLKVLELIIIAMKANNKKIYIQLIESNFLETLFDIFVKHNWNNMLHNQVEKILTHIIEGNAEELKNALFEKANVLDFIVDSSKDTEFTLSGKHARKVRKGYLGHLVRLSNKIVESKDTVIVNATENNEKWKEYVENQLKDTNQRDKTNFGGRDPRAPRQEEEVRLELPSFMQKYSRIVNMLSGKGGQNNDDKDDEEGKKEEEDEEEEEEQEEEEQEEAEEQEEDKHEEHHVVTTSDEFIEETEKTVVKPTSPRAEEEERVKQATVPVRGRHSYDPASRFIPDYDEEVKEANENKYILAADEIKTVEEKLDPGYFPNVYWRKEGMFSADDILKEMEGI